jgi:hypothetical protein
MPLKYQVKTKAEVPAEHAALYIEKDGVLILDVEGVVSKDKLEEFRTNNINLQNQLKSFEGIDVQKARELLQKQKELEEGELLKKGDVGALIESKLAPFKTDLEKERQKNQALLAQIEAAKLTDAVSAAGTKAGIRPSALPDLQARAARAFKVVDGTVVPVEAGNTLETWLEALKADAPHLFAENSGGGAAGNGSGGVGLNPGIKNPWKKETLNLTEQGRLMRTNPVLAAQLMKAA